MLYDKQNFTTGKIIKLFAFIFLGAECIACLVLFFSFIASELWWVGLLCLLFGPLPSFVIFAFIHGFGELVENSQISRNATIDGLYKLDRNNKLLQELNPNHKEIEEPKPVEPIKTSIPKPKFNTGIEADDWIVLTESYYYCNHLISKDTVGTVVRINQINKEIYYVVKIEGEGNVPIPSSKVKLLDKHA